MSKYSSEFKLEVVNFYLNNHYGGKYIARQFNIPAWTTVRKWVRKYETHGAKGLIKNSRSSYSGEFKQNVVEYMHANHLWCQEASYYLNLGNMDIVNKWERIYYEE